MQITRSRKKSDCEPAYITAAKKGISRLDG